MSYHDTVKALARDAEQLERVYSAARKSGETEAFKKAIDDSYASAPENLLYAAWFHRLKYAADRAKGFVVVWAWVIPLALINGLLLWWLSDDQRFMVELAGTRYIAGRDFLPAVALLAAPISATLVMIYLTVVGRKRWPVAALVGIVLAAASAYVLVTFPEAGTRPFQEQYLTLMVMHLPLLAWAGVGVLLIAKHRDAGNRFAFLIKSLEVFVMGGLFVIAGGLFTAITVGLFEALDIEFPELVQRLFIAGGGGLIPVVVTAVIYDPTVPPAAQSFEKGLSKSVGLLTRVMLPLTVLILLVYVGFIPFNFRAPFDNRNVLITYNGMLFAVIALLVGATPVSLTDVPPRLGRWLRLGIIAVAGLALLVSLYALAAIVYRTALDRLTPNRLTFIGWNVINIGLLSLVLLLQVRARAERWLQGLFRAYSAGTVAYTVWTLAMILAIPWLFGINQGEVDALPREVQRIIYEEPSPILLKCAGSPHIYLLQNGEKRWIDSIETFNDRGYVWRDVHTLPCDDLRAVPDGVPIPADAGPPPHP
jgi:hypothetical protein